MPTCEHCRSFGLQFDRLYEPHEFLEGNRNARIWIVGLNPKEDIDWRDSRSVDDLVNRFEDKANIPDYFKPFKIVSERLFNMFGENNGVAHTDLIKCSSQTWPPESVTSGERSTIIENCTRHLQTQLAEFSPQIIICNGSEVSAEIKRLLPPPEDFSPTTDTSYYHLKTNGQRIAVVLSGFIGRIDNYSRRRLGAEIETLLDKLPDEILTN